MSYEHEIYWESDEIIAFEYSYNDYDLKIDSWKLFKNDTEVVPDRETADNINSYIEYWLENEYSKYGIQYRLDYEESLMEKK